MERLKPWALTGLVIGPYLLANNVKSSFAFERTTHSAAVVLALVAIFLILSARVLARYSDHDSANASYTALPLEPVDGAPGSRDHSPSPILDIDAPLRTPLSRRQMLLAFVLLVASLGLRVETIRRIVGDAECSGHNYTMMLPLSFAALDFLMVQRHRAIHSITENMDDSIYDAAQQYWSKSTLKHVIPAAIMSIASTYIFRSENDPASTFICPATTLARHSLAVSRLLAFPLDFCIVYCISRLFQPSSSSFTASASSSPSSTTPRRASPVASLIAVGCAALITAFMILMTGIFVFVFSPDDRSWMLSMPPEGYISSLTSMSFLGGITVLCLCLSIYFFDVMIPASIVVFSMTSSATIASSWHNRQPFPPTSETTNYLLYCCVLAGFVMLLVAHASHNKGALFRRMPGWLVGLLFVLFLTRSIEWLAHSDHAKFHPVDMLVFEAKSQHARYVANASASTTLAAAVETYKLRYKRNPPPNFDRWYEYATTRNTKIVDDFGRIHDDLLPFWAVEPAEIRQRTWQAISNPWNDVAGISVRKGNAAISPNVMPTHRWMLDGILEMVNHFSEWLPDMDLGFNLNDECRVAVPYNEMQSLRERGGHVDSTDRSSRNSFSDGRADTWSPIPDEPVEGRMFKEMSFQRTFYDFGNVACPPESPARNRRQWDTAHICTSCAAPHSLGAFLANWTKSADICYQPDMANLHGLYLSPAAFKASHELYPVFSQSKALGYNDILYPSAWNYMDKVKYEPNDEHQDPPFEKKKKTLFWRGATSEGVSPGSGTWKGMSRQRFVHLANNINDTTPPQPVLLPHPFARSRKELVYSSVSTAELIKHMSVDVHIVDTIVRCGGRDCTDQAQEFAPLVPPSDFQSHWSYKYLLDLDGAGFSGRFLPFLSSRSLPFKAALFREWYDSRLTPWLHFVPLDLRGHGFWATLVYFAGLEGEISGRRVSLPAHDREGEMIAEKGREWAGQVLRKEDMEIYFFRLLLEWGRLTDDARDELGYEGPK